MLIASNTMLAKAKTVHDFTELRNQAEIVRDYLRKSKKQKELLFEVACLTIQAEHGLGRLLAVWSIYCDDAQIHWQVGFPRIRTRESRPSLPVGIAFGVASWDNTTVIRKRR